MTEVRYCFGVQCTYDPNNPSEGKFFIKIQIDKCTCVVCENQRDAKKKKDQTKNYFEDLNKRVIDAEEDRKVCNGKFIQDYEMKK